MTLSFLKQKDCYTSISVLELKQLPLQITFFYFVNFSLRAKYFDRMHSLHTANKCSQDQLGLLNHQILQNS